MTLTSSDIVVRFPEFATLDLSVIDRWLAEASRSHNVIQWGGKSDDGLAYLTAHLMAIFDADVGVDAGAGPVTSEREGQVAASYGVGNWAKDSEMGSTKYGRRYLSLAKTIFTTRCF